MPKLIEWEKIEKEKIFKELENKNISEEIIAKSEEERELLKWKYFKTDLEIKYLKENEP